MKTLRNLLIWLVVLFGSSAVPLVLDDDVRAMGISVVIFVAVFALGLKWIINDALARRHGSMRTKS